MIEKPMDNSDLKGIESYDDFFSLSKKLSTLNEEDLFNFLFPISISKREGNTSGTAGMLLIDLEPKHTRSCAELIDEIANSDWFVSFKEVPFYLVSQFGKWNLASEIKEYLKKSGLTESQRRRVESVWYWASSPSAKLSYDLHYFEWQEVIESE
jgi:hypothetical protein